MISLKNGLAALALAFAVTALASPSYAQEDGGIHISQQRAQAIHACNIAEAGVIGPRFRGDDSGDRSSRLRDFST
jgi:hypothetical protein